MKFRELGSFLLNFGKKLAGLKEAYEAEAEFSTDAESRTRQLCVDAIQDCFDTSKGPDGIYWLPLKDQSGRNAGRKPLILTWRLRAESAYSAVVMEVTKRYLLIKQNEPFYYKFHLFGTVNIPARPWGIGETERMEIGEILGADMKDFAIQYINDNLVWSRS